MTAGNFSQAPLDVLVSALAKGYVSVHVEQGVPVLDRDLNLLGDLISTLLRQTVQRHVGDGTAGTTDFAIVANGNPIDFAITRGTFLAGGLTITLTANSSYLTQTVPATAIPPPPLPALTPQSTGQPNPRVDTVYLDVWSDEIDDTTDPSLGNSVDIGLRTSTRTKAEFVVRVAENASTVPAPPPAGHTFVAIASLSRAPGGAVTISDLRQTQLAISVIAQRMAVIESVLSPIITAVAPNLVLPGQANPMVITGSNLNLGGVTVQLGNVPAPVSAGATATSLTVPVPANAVPGPNTLTVQTAIGSATASAPVTVQAPPPPPTFVPSSGSTPQIVPAHAPTGNTVQLNGTHFTGVNRVTFNATPPVAAVSGGDLVSVTDTMITVRVPDALSTAVNATMTLTASVDGVPALTSKPSDQLFTVDPQPILPPVFGPTGSQITTTPATSPVAQSHGGQVTLHGANFGNSVTTTSVTFIGTNSVPAQPSDFVSVTPTAITVKVPVALTVAAAPNNRCFIAVTVQNVSKRSDDTLLVT